MAFFEYCVKCRQMFQNEAAWNQHLASHHASKNVGEKTDAFKEVEEKRIIETAAVVPGADKAEIEDARVAKTIELRTVKKALKKAGIECQTMTAAEARAAYDKAVAAGKIKE